MQYSKFIITIFGLYYLSDTFYSYKSVDSSYTFMGKIMGEALATFIIVCYTTKVIFGYMSFKNMSFDIVFSKDSIVHVEKKEELSKEIFRVLKKGDIF